jgi:hypothetical protein
VRRSLLTWRVIPTRLIRRRRQSSWGGQDTNRSECRGSQGDSRYPSLHTPQTKDLLQKVSWKVWIRYPSSFKRAVWGITDRPK